jgi:fructose-specific phosphotransferase system component IIB
MSSECEQVGEVALLRFHSGLNARVHVVRLEAQDSVADCPYPRQELEGSKGHQNTCQETEITFSDVVTGSVQQYLHRDSRHGVRNWIKYQKISILAASRDREKEMQNKQTNTTASTHMNCRKRADREVLGGL